MQALAGSRRPRSVLEWLRRPNGGAALLRDILGRGVPLTHEVLDEHDPRAVWTLRQALVQLEVLPARNEHLAQLTAAAGRLLQDLPAHHRHVLAPHLHWHVLPEARARLARAGRFTIGHRRAAQRRVTSAAGLLGWLDDNDLTLRTLTQHRLEDWLSTGSINRRDVADLLNWTRRRGLTVHLRVRRPPRGPAELVLPEAERWQHLRRCLHDEQLPPDVAAAGGLILLFGLQTARIVELTTDHLEVAPATSKQPHGSTSAPSADFVRVTLTSPPLPVPPALAALLHRLPFQSPGVIPLLPSHTAPPWLFPGRASGRHIGAAALAARLRAHGIPV